ncbi:MAG: TetR/AcrR family transcriptional regulator [Devosia sp.]
MSDAEDTIQRSAAQTQRRILDAAREEFSSHGYGSARMDRIATAARASKPMIYTYFGGKDDLYKAALQEAYARIREGERALETEHMDPEDAIRELVHFTMNHFVTNPWFISLLNTENLRGGVTIREIDRLSEVQSPLIQKIREILERGTGSGVFRQEIDPTELYVFIASLCYFPVSNRHTLRVGFDLSIDEPWLKAHADEAGEMVVRYLRVV